MADPFAPYVVKDDPFAAYAQAAPAAPQDAGFLAGVGHMLPTPTHVLEGLKAIPGNIKQALSPTALDDMWANRANTPVGKVLNGRPGEGAGEIASILGQLAIPEAVGRIRSSFTPPPPETVKGIPVEDLKAAGVGDQSLDIMRNGRPKPAPTQGRIQTQTPQPTYPTAGSSALQPEYQPVDAPVAPPQPAQPQGAISPTRQIELLQKFGGTAEPPKVLPLGQPRIMSLKETPTSWTPEAARARLEFNDWHSGAEPGTPEAQSAQAMHRYDGETASRYKYLLDSPNGSVSGEVLKHFGVPARYLAAPFIAKGVGLPGWTGPLGVGAYDLARAYPQQSLEATRAALIAQMGPRTGNSAPR